MDKPEVAEVQPQWEVKKPLSPFKGSGGAAPELFAETSVLRRVLGLSATKWSAHCVGSMKKDRNEFMVAHDTNRASGREQLSHLAQTLLSTVTGTPLPASIKSPRNASRSDVSAALRLLCSRSASA